MGIVGGMKIKIYCSCDGFCRFGKCSCYWVIRGVDMVSLMLLGKLYCSLENYVVCFFGVLRKLVKV